jgi:hypothetical protein
MRVREGLEAEKEALTAVNVEVEKGVKVYQKLLLAKDLTNAARPGLTPKTTDLLFDDEFLTRADLGIKKMEEIKDAGLDLSDTLAQSFANIGSSFAQSLGEVAAGSRTLEEALKNISAQILSALGDILILTGLSTSPVGVPLVLAGLALKGFGSFVNASGNSVSGGGGSPFNTSTVTSADLSRSVLYGNDIRNSNNYYTDLYKRVG